MNIEIKVALWRFLRVFIASFLAGSAIVLSAVGPECFVSWSSFLDKLVIPACIAGLTASISAVGRLMRELWKDEEWATKLPF